MSQAGLIFITAPEADKNTINRLLIHLRDYEFSDEIDWDSFRIVSTKDVEALKAAITNEEVRPTKPPVTDEANTAVWQNASLDEVEAFMLPITQHFYTISTNTNPHNPVILDSRGLAEKTCIVLERQHDEDEDSSTPLDAFNKVRVPWTNVHSMWVNLDIANMNFEDFCDEEEGPDGEGWWAYDRLSGEEEDEFKEARERDINEIEPKKEEQ